MCVCIGGEGLNHWIIVFIHFFVYHSKRRQYCMVVKNQVYESDRSMFAFQLCRFHAGDLNNNKI